MSSKVPFNAKKNSLRIDFEPLPLKDPDEGPDDETTCGVGSFRPAWLQVLGTPKAFLLNHALLGVLQGAFFTYLVGCLSTLEKRFSYESKITGVIMIADEVSPILFGALLGYFGGKGHRPRIVMLGMLVGVLSCFVMAAPYFVFGRAKDDLARSRLLNRTSKYEFCDGDGEDGGCGEATPTFSAVSMLFAGNFLKGFGSLAFYTVGTSYLDDGVKKKNSPAYFGTLFSLRLLGPTSGFLLSSLCLSFYEDPFHDPGYGPKDPRWVGAWWMGFVILGVLIFVFSLPMMLFPKRFPGKRKPEKKEKEKEVKTKTPMEQLKEMGKALQRLGRNPILACHYLGGVLRLNGIVGYYVLLPKYMEMQFKQSASKASLYSGPAGLVGMMVGIMVGGLAIRKFKPRPRKLTGGIVFAESFSFISILVCMAITCPVAHVSGVGEAGVNLTSACNEDCLCSTKVLTPVCDGSDTYFSPCHAGCSGYNKTDGKEVFTDCRCIPGEGSAGWSGEAAKGYCGPECGWMVAFIIALSVGKLLASTARVGNAIVTLRCVDPEDKSLALGALSGIFSLLAFIPYPLIYGALTDASCVVWEESCGRRGNCWLYDADKFRYLLHGVSAAFIFLGCLTDVFVCLLSPRLKNLYDDDDREAAEAVANAGVFKTGSVASLHNTSD